MVTWQLCTYINFNNCCGITNLLLRIFILRKFGAIQYCLSDNNEVWSDRLSDQRIRREPKGLSCICLVDCESDPYVRSIVCMV